jgi:RHS repeat-associated protein
MAVTNYYSAGGELLGEKTVGGSRIDYLTDALGSVTATVDQTGSVVNRYRYKPYGGLLSKSGAGADPSFQWVGSQGYRQTGKKYSDVYVRARHYDTANGRWTRKDPIGFAVGDWNVYSYSGDSPAVFHDASGLFRVYNPACGRKTAYIICTCPSEGDRAAVAIGPDCGDDISKYISPIEALKDCLKPTGEDCVAISGNFYIDHTAGGELIGGGKDCHGRLRGADNPKNTGRVSFGNGFLTGKTIDTGPNCEKLVYLPSRRSSRVIAFMRGSCQCFMVDTADETKGMDGKAICACIRQSWASCGMGMGSGSTAFVMMDGGGTTTLAFAKGPDVTDSPITGRSPSFFTICGKRQNAQKEQH